MTHDEIKKLVDEAREKASKATEGPWSRRLGKSFCHQDVVNANLCKHDKFVTTNCSTQEKTYECSGAENWNWAEIVGPSMWQHEVDWKTSSMGVQYMYEEDAAFIAHSRTAIPQLCDAIDLLMKQSEILREQRNTAIKKHEHQKVFGIAMADIAIEEANEELLNKIGAQG